MLPDVHLCGGARTGVMAEAGEAESRQEYWSGLPFPSPGDLPDPGMKPGSFALEVDSLLSEPPGKPLCLFTNLSVIQ